METDPRLYHVDVIRPDQLQYALEDLIVRSYTAYDRYDQLKKKYDGLPEEVRTSERITQAYREECHSEFAGTGMYKGVISFLIELVNEAEREQSKADLDSSAEILCIVVDFLEPIEGKLRDWTKMFSAHHRVEKELREEEEEKKKKGEKKKKKKKGEEKIMVEEKTANEAVEKKQKKKDTCKE